VAVGNICFYVICTFAGLAVVQIVFSVFVRASPVILGLSILWELPVMHVKMLPKEKYVHIMSCRCSQKTRVKNIFEVNPNCCHIKVGCIKKKIPLPNSPLPFLKIYIFPNLASL